MVRVRSFSVALLACTALFAPRPAAAQSFAQSVATFENPTLAQPLPGPNTYQNGATLNPPGSFTSGGAVFNNSYTPAYDSFSGWAYSNVTNVTTPGFGNQYAAYNLPGGGTGDASPNYGIAYNFSPGDATIGLPAGAAPRSIRLTNTTYAALSIRDGDQFAKKFGGPTGNDPDFFRLTILGTNAANLPTGSVDFFLADYRSADNSQDYIVSAWTTVDLTTLAPDTSKLSFTLTSTDIGPFGMNTPAYFAADNLVLLTPVPEPTTTLLVAAAGATAGAAWRRRGRAGSRVRAS